MIHATFNIDNFLTFEGWKEYLDRGSQLLIFKIIDPTLAISIESKSIQFSILGLKYSMLISTCSSNNFSFAPYELGH